MSRRRMDGKEVIGGWNPVYTWFVKHVSVTISTICAYVVMAT
jgi:hypothetical protein